MEEKLKELRQQYANLCAMLGEQTALFELKRQELITEIGKVQEQHKALMPKEKQDGTKEG